MRLTKYTYSSAVSTQSSTPTPPSLRTWGTWSTTPGLGVVEEHVNRVARQRGSRYEHLDIGDAVEP